MCRNQNKKWQSYLVEKVVNKYQSIFMADFFLYLTFSRTYVDICFTEIVTKTQFEREGKLLRYTTVITLNINIYNSHERVFNDEMSGITLGVIEQLSSLAGISLSFFFVSSA